MSWSVYTFSRQQIVAGLKLHLISLIWKDQTLIKGKYIIHQYINTVKPVLKSHLWDNKKMVL